MAERYTPASEIAKLNLSPRPHKEPQHVAILLEHFLDELKQNQEGETIGVKTGFIDLDRLTGGFRPEELVLVGGRTSTSEFALNIAANVVFETKGSVLYFSLASSNETQLARMLAMLTGISRERIFSNSKQLSRLETQKLGQAIGMLSEASLFFNDDNLDLPGFAQQIQAWLSKGDTDLVVIDSVQALIKNSPLWEKSDVVYYLKRLAQVSKVPILVTSQVTHHVDFRRDHVPGLGDLEGLGDYPDKVIFLYHEDWYQKDTERKGMVDVYVKKNINGLTGMMTLLYAEREGKFIDLAPYME